MKNALVVTAAVLGLLGCSTTPPPPPGSREEAVYQAWQRFCAARYCDGFPGTIMKTTDTLLTVSINGNTRFVNYTVSGGPGNYSVQMRPTANGGSTPPQ